MALSQNQSDYIHQGLVRQIDLAPSAVLAYIVGVSLGDANFFHKVVGTRRQHRYILRLQVSLHDSAFCRSFGSALLEVGLHPYYYMREQSREHGGKMACVRTNSKMLVKYLEMLTDESVRELVFSSTEATEMFLRGIYESDGSFWRRLTKWDSLEGMKQKRQAVFSIKNTSFSLIKLCRDVIDKLVGYQYAIKTAKTPKGKPAYELNIKGARALKLLSLVNPCIKRGEER